MVSKDYLKEYNRVRRLYKSYQKRGYDIGFELPSKVKKPTKSSIRRLKNITPDYIIRNSTYKLSTGEVIPGIVRRGQERRAAGKKSAIKKTLGKVAKLAELPQEENLILSKMQQVIESWSAQLDWSSGKSARTLDKIKQQDVDTIKTMLEGAIQQYGEKAVLNNIKKNSKQISDILERALYGGYTSNRNTFDNARQQMDHDFVTFAELLKGEPLTSDEVIKWTDLMEEQDFYR